MKYERLKKISIYELDFFVNDSVVLELNGKIHYMRDLDENIPPSLTSGTLLKSKHLKLLGFSNIEHISFRDWEFMDRNR